MPGDLFGSQFERSATVCLFVLQGEVVETQKAETHCESAYDMTITDARK